jgi:hypothetical protein
VVVGDQIQKNSGCCMSICQRDEECVRNLKRDRHRCTDNIMNRIDVVAKFRNTTFNMDGQSPK